MVSIGKESFIRTYKNVLEDNLIDELIAHADEPLPDFTILENEGNTDELAGYGKGEEQFKDKKIGRQDTQLFLSYTNVVLLNKVHEALLPYFKQYKEEFAALETVESLRSYEVKLQKTPPGGGYSTWHCEHGSLSTGNRVLTWLVYLNDMENEGSTEFLYQGHNEYPTKGTLVIFPAAFTHLHRGNPPYSKDKYIVTGWGEFGPPMMKR